MVRILKRLDRIVLQYILTITKFSLALFLLVAPLTYAKSQVVLGTINFPPNIVSDPATGQCSGRYITNLTEILGQYDIELTSVCTNPARLYKLVSQGEVDFTVNVKSTQALKNHVEFIEPAYQVLKLFLYSHAIPEKPGSIAAIRGFDYHGVRLALSEQGYGFVDLPNTEAAIKLFTKKRSTHLISYADPFLYYTKAQGHTQINALHLADVGTFIAVAKTSPHLKTLQLAFDDYARTNQIKLFFKE